MRFLRNSLIALASLAAALWMSLAPGDPALYPPPPGEERFEVQVVDHGWHTGLIVAPRDLAAAAIAMPDEEADEASLLLALARIMGAADWIEIGWGDEAFYRADVATAWEVPLGVSFGALFGGGATTLHVFPGLGSPAAAFPASDTVFLTLGETGFRRLALALARSFAIRDGLPEDIGPGIYGNARFYRARGTYSPLRTCNNWTAEMLAAAGAPASWVASTFSFGLMSELKARAL